MNLNNFIESKMREFQITVSSLSEFRELYDNVENIKLKAIFVHLHEEYIRLFRTMNERLPTEDFTAHFWAEPSRYLINIIEATYELKNKLKSTELAFEIEKDYLNIIANCRDFLRKSGGSSIPEHTPKIELYYTIPIFTLSGSIVIERPQEKIYSSLKLIGEGSYAQVFKYKDEFYNKKFALKRAKKDLNEKEIERFKREFEQMKSLNSLYIVEVYTFSEETIEYTMEFLDSTLTRFIEENNSKMTIQVRRSIVLQLLNAYVYLHSKGLFHRDVSGKNVLIKKYEDVLVVKISDFGLVKIKESDVTSDNTEFKGSLNDPSLKTEGFRNYTLEHEIYALTLLIVYVITGKSNFGIIKNEDVRAFMQKGTHSDKAKRYKSLDELREAALKILKQKE